MSVTLIAEKAGVSIATVSRVLNNSRPVKPEIAEAVRRAAEELNLPVKPPRRRKERNRGRQATTIAIVSIGQSYRGWFDVPIIASVVAEVSRAAQDADMGIFISEVSHPPELPATLKRPEVGGAVAFISGNVTREQVRAIQVHLPLVRVMGGSIASLEVDQVASDSNAVGFLAARHLLNSGVTNLAFLTLQSGWDFIRLRAQGFIIGAEDIAGRTPTCYIAAAPDAPRGMYGPHCVVEQSLEQLVKQLVKQREKGRIGLFVPRDEETVEVYRALREHGLEPERDVLVVSCDNEQVRLSALHPRPASIDLSVAEIARRAVRRLAYRMKHRDDAAVRTLISPTLPLSPADPASL
jgi:DNA-binding LacI/PurR family transcriptional regulator